MEDTLWRERDRWQRQSFVEDVGLEGVKLDAEALAITSDPDDVRGELTTLGVASVEPFTLLVKLRYSHSPRGTRTHSGLGRASSLVVAKSLMRVA